MNRNIHQQDRQNYSLGLFQYQRKKKISPKLHKTWEGSYLITKKINDLVCRIQLTAKSKPKVRDFLLINKVVRAMEGSNVTTQYRHTCSDKISTSSIRADYITALTCVLRVSGKRDATIFFGYGFRQRWKYFESSMPL